MESAGRCAARSGARLLVDALRIHGADIVFGLPGESYLAVLDALYDARDVIRFIICRHEGGAANMADAYGKLTGRPGICFVTRGPGATNASIGIHMMNGQELATAMQYDARVIFIVVNNGMLGTIRMHQERQYRVLGTELRNPDFVALARAYGLHAERIEATGEFAPAFERARQADRAALIEIKVDPEAITP